MSTTYLEAQARIEGQYDDVANELRAEVHRVVGAQVATSYPVVVSSKVTMPQFCDDGCGPFIAVPLQWIIDRTDMP